jgi:hypothetical protein
MSNIDVSDVLDDLLFSLNIVWITSNININGLSVETRQNVLIKGNIQNYKGQEIELLREGQRAWIWKQLQCSNLNKYVFNINDRLIYQNIEYKVMQKRDYNEYGYIKYILCQNYQG